MDRFVFEGGREGQFNINFALITNRCFNYLIIKRDSIDVYIYILYVIRNKMRLGRGVKSIK